APLPPRCTRNSTSQARIGTVVALGIEPSLNVFLGVGDRLYSRAASGNRRWEVAAMTSTAEFHQNQMAYWNGPGGARWTNETASTERMLSRVAALLYEHAKIKPGETVLDIGCGLGPTTIELAKQAGPSGRAVGLDVSTNMIALARQRAAGIANIEFIAGDAATHNFAAPFADVLFS